MEKGYTLIRHPVEDDSNIVLCVSGLTTIKHRIDLVCEICANESLTTQESGIRVEEPGEQR